MEDKDSNETTRQFTTDEKDSWKALMRNLKLHRNCAKAKAEVPESNRHLDNQSKGNFEHEIEDSTENQLYNPICDQPKHGEIREQLVMASSTNNKDAGDFHD